MRKPLFLLALLTCLLLFGGRLHALDLKFTSPADLSRSLVAVASPKLLSVVAEEGGVLRFATGDQQGYCQTALATNGTAIQQANGDLGATFRFGGDKGSFGVYLHVTGDTEDAYLALVNIAPGGQGTLRLFKVPPRARVEDQHQIAREAVRSPLNPGTWYTLKLKKATQSNKAVQITAELSSVGGATTTATAVDASGLVSAGAMHLRFFASDPGQHIDVKQVTLAPAKPAGR